MSDRRRTYAMFAIVTLACALGSLTQTVMNSMLGGVQATFGTPESISQWLTTIYMLTIGIAVPFVTHLSRRFAARTLILASLAISLAGALLGALAPTFEVLFCARVLQAVGTGITLPIMQTIAMTRFPPGQNGTAMGICGIAMGFAPNIGPLIGGAVVWTLGWRSFFWMLAVVLIVLGGCTFALVKPRPHDVEGAHLDALSAILSTTGFGCLLVSFTSLSYRPVSDPGIWIELAAGAFCVAWFVVRQRRIEHPLIRMSIFGSRNYVVSFVVQNLLFASFMGITLILPLFAVNACGMSTVDAGMIFLPATFIAIVFNPLAGILSDKIGARPVVVAAATLLALASVAMAFMDASIPLWAIMALQAARAVGVSSLIGPLNSWGMSQLDHRIMVDGSAFFTTARQTCASLGTALMMMLVSLLGGTLGYNLALGLSGVFAVGVFVGAILFVHDAPARTKASR